MKRFERLLRFSVLVAALVLCSACGMTRNALWHRVSGSTVKVLVLHRNVNSLLPVHGTGVAVKTEENGYLITTSRHVLVPPTEFPARESFINVEHPRLGNVMVSCTVVATSADLALLRVETDKKLEVVPLARSVPPPFSDVYHYGFGGRWYKGAFATKGIMSSPGRVWPYAPTALTTTGCHIWYGCSGGGIFNRKGELLGIASQLDIERDTRLPWLVAIIPYTEIRKLMERAETESE